MADENVTIDEAEEQVDERREQLRREALRHVRQWGDPVLRSVTSDVTAFDDVLASELDRMVLLMEDAIGAGLAAPQVGSLKRMFVYRVDRESEPVAVINPKITFMSEEQELDFEGCLSLNGVLLEVPRSIKVTVEAFDVSGSPVTIEAEGFEARVIQHEYDHLEGVMIIDRVPAAERREALRTLRDSIAGEPVS
jgi:peptide deformylase